MRANTTTALCFQIDDTDEPAIMTFPSVKANEKPLHPLFVKHQKAQSLRSPAIMATPPFGQSRQSRSGDARTPIAITQKASPTLGGVAVSSNHNRRVDALLSTNSIPTPPPSSPPGSQSHPIVTTPGPSTSTSESTHTPTQFLFRSLVEVEPLSMKFDNEDFFRMMNLRAQHQWDSRKFNTKGWNQATELFNRSRTSAGGPTANIPIQVGTLQKQLLAVEEIIRYRHEHGDYKTRGKESTTFWTKHCNAVPGFDLETQQLSAALKEQKQQEKKEATGKVRVFGFYLVSTNVLVTIGFEEKWRSAKASDLPPMSPGQISAGSASSQSCKRHM